MLTTRRLWCSKRRTHVPPAEVRDQTKYRKIKALQRRREDKTQRAADPVTWAGCRVASAAAGQ